MNSESPQNGPGWISDAVQRYGGQLVRYAARLLGDEERARDVTQDTFVKLCGQDQSELAGKLAAWLFKVCRNRALDVQKKEKRMTTLTEQTADGCASRESAPEAVASLAESSGQIERLIEQLPYDQQEVLRLKIQNGLSYREISDVMGLSRSNVGYLLHTAIKRVREQVAACERK